MCSIERMVEIGQKRTHAIKYYICSLDASAERLMEITREHWKIESMHWMLDVTFSEDQCYFSSENAQKNLECYAKMHFGCP